MKTNTHTAVILYLPTVALILVLIAGSEAWAEDGVSVESQHVAKTESKLHFDWLGKGRTISKGWSASRDTSVMTMNFFPRPFLKGGGAFALMSLANASGILYLGFEGFIELLVDGETRGTNAGLAPWGDGWMLWRGSYSYYLAASSQRLMSGICSHCEVEAAVSYRHESEHYTGSNHGPWGIDATLTPYVGDDVIVDLGVGQYVGRWYFAERVTGMWFLPDASSYSFGVASDIHVRWRQWRLIHPFFSGYTEFKSGTEWRHQQYPDAYRIRGLLGVALPGSLGDILVYLSGDVGHRYGIRANMEEATLGLGVRLLPGKSE
ncbi:MAG: hypothetical protein JXX14_19670 [Deltaproteobacteria bacterium]|nr:hypothetical protein [Deltaproteobacteria bacterium]